MKHNPNIIFMGTPEFAIPSMISIYEKFGLGGVVTTPDKPKGRGQSFQPSAVKLKALELTLPIFQPASLKDENFLRSMNKMNPDIFVVIAFRILPSALYKMANIGAFNLHASLLPLYRGAAPLNWAIINGENVTGITSFLLKDKVDTGDILLQQEIDIPNGATAGDLHDLMMPMAAEMAVKTVDLLISGSYEVMEQNNDLSTPAPKIFRDQCRIDWSNNAVRLGNFIHGVSPVPGAWTILNGNRIKILRVSIKRNESKLQPGEYLISENLMEVGCLVGSLSISELQYEGKRPLIIQEFLRGFRGNSHARFE